MSNWAIGQAFILIDELLAMVVIAKFWQLFLSEKI